VAQVRARVRARVRVRVRVILTLTVTLTLTLTLILTLTLTRLTRAAEEQQDFEALVAAHEDCLAALHAQCFLQAG
jgi:hypothetical protein